MFRSLGLAVEDLAAAECVVAPGAETGTGTRSSCDRAGGDRAARGRIAGAAVRTPLVRLHVDAPAEI